MKRIGWSSTLALLAATAVLLAGCAGGVSSNSSSSGNAHSTVTIGYEMPLSGPFAALGIQEKDGWNLAMSQAGNRAGGHPIKTIFGDNQFQPTVSLTLAKQFVEGDHVDMVEGPSDSASQIALVNYLGPQGVPTDDITLCTAQQVPAYKKYNYGFTSGWSCPQQLATLGKWAGAQHYKNVTVIGLDNAYGWVTVGSFLDAFNKAGGTVAKVMWAPGTTTDFSPYISQIPSDTGAVYAELSGATAIQFVQAYHKFGLNYPLLGGSVLADQSVMPAMGSAALGITVASNYCEGSSNSATQAFVSAFKKKYGLIPGGQAEGAYVHAELVLAALKKLGSQAPNHKNLLHALMNTPINTPVGPEAINKTYFAANQNLYICKVEQTPAGLENVPIKTYPNQPPLTQNEQAAFTHDSSARPSTTGG